jgi:ubiquinone/menaquinone biosynthesis C-methylase UbiE
MAGRSWRETYTPRNIVLEIGHRVSQLRRRPPRREDERAAVPYDDGHARQVGAFYDTHHDAFMRVYGDVIQALRTLDTTVLLDQQLTWMGLASGERVLDAGCGVAAPAVHFAHKVDVNVEAITISARQAADAHARVAREGLTDRVQVRQGDYHRLREYYPPASFDVVYFLESFGHSRDTARLVHECWHVLKPGGRLCIKDLFVRVLPQPAHAAVIAREVARINEAYHYAVGDLNRLLDVVRGAGFTVASLGEVDLDLEAFEDLAISNQFQELTGLAPIQDWASYVFPVDFFQLTCVKPTYNALQRLDWHRLQHRLHAGDRVG